MASTHALLSRWLRSTVFVATLLPQAACLEPVQLGGVAVAPGVYQRMLLATRFGHDELEERVDAPSSPAPPESPEPPHDAAPVAADRVDVAPRALDVPPSSGGCMPAVNDDPAADGDRDRAGRTNPR